MVGGSREGFAIENIVSALQKWASCGFYRTAGGAEVNLVADPGAGGLWAIEFKRSTAPTVSRGFHNACEDLGPTRKFVVHGGAQSFPVGKGINAVTLSAMVALANAA